MNKFYILFASLALAANVNAEDFSVGNLYFDFSTSADNECWVTYPNSADNSYEGDIVIPPSVSFGGSNYLVSGISEYAFSGCGNLISVDIPETVTFIGRNAFSNCNSLTFIALPPSITEIDEQTFLNCFSLENVEMSENIKHIGPTAFYGCASLLTITLPDGLEEIGPSAFAGCSRLGDILLPSGLKNLGAEAFKGCRALKEIEIPEGLTSIPSYLCADCVSLENVILPSGIETIGEGSFSNCSSMKQPAWPASLQEIGKNAFSMCSGMTSILFDNNDLILRDFAFSGCRSLEEIYLYGVSEIGEGCFSNGESLQTVWMSGSMSNIGNRAFQNCGAITSVNVARDIPPILSNTSFDNSIYTQASLVVPSDKVLLYIQTPPWSYFLIVEELPAGVENIAANPDFALKIENGEILVGGFDNILPYKLYTLNGSLIREGEIADGGVISNLISDTIYILHIGKKSFKILIK